MDIKAPDVPANTSSLSLFPGEGVYSKTTTTAPSTTPSANIQYTYLSSSSKIESHEVNADLLTFNTNTNAGGSAETGTTVASASVNVIPEGRYIQPLSNELIRIDAGDMLRRSGNWNTSNYPRPNITRKIIINEN